MQPRYTLHQQCLFGEVVGTAANQALWALKWSKREWSAATGLSALLGLPCSLAGIKYIKYAPEGH